ncbi:MAG: nuclear transport factor 2 family protein [Ruminococcaceae bacterium]|nr:nuclear transport factor 2 family protein [Oscillospiraceae bacterium]
MNNAILTKAGRVMGGKECRNLMGRYAFYYSAFRFADLADLWARREDSLLVMPWGIYDGYESIRRCYVEQMGDRNNPGMEQFLKGKMFLREFNTEILAVAGDAKTARGFWISMGQDAYMKDNGFAQADWVWAKYAVEFINDGGVWRIWKLRVFPVFSCPFETDWSVNPEYKGFVFENAQPDRPLPEPLWHWTLTGSYPSDQPDFPKDYDSYEDIGFIL